MGKRVEIRRWLGLGGLQFSTRVSESKEGDRPGHLVPSSGLKCVCVCVCSRVGGMMCHKPKLFPHIAWDAKEVGNRKGWDSANLYTPCP